MRKVHLELSAYQAEQLLEQLPVEAKLDLVRRWEHETWPKRFRRLVEEVGRRAQSHPRLARKALKDIAPARRAFYAARRARH